MGWRAVVLLMLGFVVFGESLTFGFLPYDDGATVTGNGYVNRGVTVDGLAWALGYGGSVQELGHEGVTNLWHPLTWVSHMVDVSLFGIGNPWGHHLTGLALHLISGLLVLFLGWRLVENKNAALLVAALWLVHPMKVESVAWISERKDVLSGVFFWASLLCMLGSRGEPRTSWSCLGLAFFVLAILGKPSVVVLPLLLILLKGLQARPETPAARWSWDFWKGSFWNYRWWFLISILASLVTVLMQLSGTHGEAADQSSLGGRLLPQAWAMGFYLWRFLIPSRLSIDYPQPDLPALLMVSSWLVLLALLAALWRFRERVPHLFFAVAWWCVCLLPVSGLFYVGTSFTSDRYLYLASAGPLFAMAAYLQGRSRLFRPVAVVASLVVVLWSVLSFFQCKVWRDGWSLFTQVTQAQPKSAMGWSNLGSMYLRSGRLPEAKTSFQKALTLDPNDYIAWFNLALSEQKFGTGEAATNAYRRSLAINPSYLPSLKNLGILLFSQGELEEGLESFRRACQISNFKRPEVLLLACEASLRLGDIEGSENYLKRLEVLPIRNPVYLEAVKKMRQLLEDSR